jgi:acyl-CoA thioester hydrolase
MSANRTASVTIRVYYEDTDFSGLVYHASYLRFLERGRTEFLREAGFSNRKLAESNGVIFAVRTLQIDYIAAAMMDDLLRTDTRIARVAGASLLFEQRVFRDDREIVFAKVLVAALREGKPTRIPKPLRDVLEGFGAAS